MNGSFSIKKLKGEFSERMAQPNQNRINQIQQLLNHGVQDINQVLPLLPPIAHHLQLQDQKIPNLHASLASSQANCKNLNPSVLMIRY